MAKKDAGKVDQKKGKKKKDEEDEEIKVEQATKPAYRQTLQGLSTRVVGWLVERD